MSMLASFLAVKMLTPLQHFPTDTHLGRAQAGTHGIAPFSILHPPHQPAPALAEFLITNYHGLTRGPSQPETPDSESER